jgi:hypothetical protein
VKFRIFYIEGVRASLCMEESSKLKKKLENRLPSFVNQKRWDNRLLTGWNGKNGTKDEKCS